jgi:cytoskeleton protein RodZ
MSDQKDSQTIIGAGRVFAEGREALDLTREQTADILNLSVRMVRALEESKPDQLPEKVYVNGYIRSYAKLLGLASQPLIDAWWAQHSEQANNINAAEPVFDRASGEKVLRPFKMGRWAALALVLSAGFVYFVTNSDQGGVEEDASEASQPALAMPEADQAEVLGDRSPAQGLDALAPEADPVDSEFVADDGTEDVAGLAGTELAVAAPGQVPPDQESLALETILESQQQAIVVAQDISRRAPERPQEGVQESVQEVEDASQIAADPVTDEQTSSQMLAFATPGETQGQQDAGSASAEEPTAIDDQFTESAELAQEAAALEERELPTAYALPRLTALGDDEIQLSFTSDCWFELRDEAGVLLYADLGRTGQARRYIGAGPFRIKLGYSPGVRLMFNGGEVDLQPFTRWDVANLTVGADAPSDSASEPSPST